MAELDRASLSTQDEQETISGAHLCPSWARGVTASG